MHRSALPTRPFAVAIILAGAGCQGSPSARETVEIIDWWVNAGEAPALGALIENFEVNNPDQRVLNTAIDSSADARKRIIERMVARQPPETFQANGGGDLLAWVVTNNVDDKETRMAPLDGLVDWTAAFPAPVLETVRFGDTVYGVPLGIHRVNTLFFNRKVFADRNLPAPSIGTLATLDDLFQLATTLRAQGVAAPIALGMRDPWTLSLLLFENVLVARAGGEGYRQFFAGTEAVLGSAMMERTLRDLTTLLRFTNDDAERITWDQALDLVLRGEAAMTIMGDWAKGYVLDQARKDGLKIDIGQIPTPGTDGTFVFTTDTFGLPIGARNPEGALSLLSLFASVEGQDTFSLIKGSIPARQDAGMKGPYDSDALNTLNEFRTVSGDYNRLVPATAIVARPEYMNAINDVLSDFAGATKHLGDVRGNSSVVMHALENHRDVLRDTPWR